MKVRSIPVRSPPGLRDVINATEGFRWANGENALAMLVNAQPEWLSIRDSFPSTKRAAVPIVTLSAFQAADVIAAPGSIEGALAIIRPIASRIEELPERILEDDDEAGGLLAYLWVRDADLKPVTDPGRPRVVDFAERGRFPELDDWVERLTERGLLHPSFEERLNCCTTCGSSRLLVRDQCVSCGSSNIVDQAVIHHFPCACQAPEKSFRDENGGLRCPKCRRALHHISIDYEVSADLCACLACGDVTHRAVAGFRCLDCGSSGRGQDLVERDVHGYGLTAAGRALFQQEIAMSSGSSEPAMATPGG